MKGIKRCLIIGWIACILFLLPFGSLTIFGAEEDEQSIIVLGEKLTEAQKDEVRQLLEISSSENVKEYIVSGADYANYIDGNPDANMYSSAKIVRKGEGYGIRIQIVTPENITKVTPDMYRNALLTAGAEDAYVVVASPVRVTGESALTGIYKAYDVEGERLDKERMMLANEELELATDLAEKDGLSQEKVSELLAEIKKAISEQNPITREEIEKIIEEQLEKLEIRLNPEDKELLLNLFEKMKDLNINFSKVRDQLEEIASSIKDKVDELGIDQNFVQKVFHSIKQFFQSIRSFFEGLFK